MEDNGCFLIRLGDAKAETHLFSADISQYFFRQFGWWQTVAFVVPDRFDSRGKGGAVGRVFPDGCGKPAPLAAAAMIARLDK